MVHHGGSDWILATEDVQAKRAGLLSRRTTSKQVRRADKQEAWQSPTHQVGRRSSDAGPTTFDELWKDDQKRKRLLALARHTAPLTTVGNLAILPRTVIPRLLHHWLTWAVFLIYTATAVLARLGMGEFNITVMQVDAFSGVSTLVTFMIIFYVSFCCAPSKLYWHCPPALCTARQSRPHYLVQ